MPVSMTSTGKPVIDETVLKEIGTDTALKVFDTTGSDEAVRNDIRRRERMAEAMYEV